MMRSGGNNFTYFPENKLTKLANFVQFIRMVMFCLEDLGASALCLPLGYATEQSGDEMKLKLCNRPAYTRMRRADDLSSSSSRRDDYHKLTAPSCCDSTCKSINLRARR